MFQIVTKESEKVLESRLCQAIKSKGGECVKLTSQYQRGLPDRLVLLPGGRVCFVELKSTGKKPTALQSLCHERLRAMGFEVVVVDSSEGLSGFLRGLGSGEKVAEKA